MWRSRSTRSAWCFACSVISAGAAPGARRQRQRTRANWSRRGAISSGVSAAAELIVRCCGASFRTCRTSSPSSNASSARAMSGQRRDPAYHQGQRFHRWRQRLAGRASELEQALRRADRCAAWKSSPASASTNCAPCAMPALLRLRRRCSATRASRRAEPRRGGQSRQGFRRTRGSPASAAACRANNAMGVIRRYS